jgi:hypothetical protein
MNKMNEIYAEVLPEMERQGIADTSENRILFLRGMLDSWLEDKDDANYHKVFYLMSVQTEIIRLKSKMAMS